MGLTEIQAAMDANAGSNKAETGFWSVNVRLNLADEKEALIAKKIRALIKSTGLGGGPLAIELLDEILKQIEVPVEEA